MATNVNLANVTDIEGFTINGAVCNPNDGATYGILNGSSGT